MIATSCPRALPLNVGQRERREAPQPVHARCISRKLCLHVPIPPRPPPTSAEGTLQRKGPAHRLPTLMRRGLCSLPGAGEPTGQPRGHRDPRSKEELRRASAQGTEPCSHHTTAWDTSRPLLKVTDTLRKGPPLSPVTSAGRHFHAVSPL